MVPLCLCSALFFLPGPWEDEAGGLSPNAAFTCLNVSSCEPNTHLLFAEQDGEGFCYNNIIIKKIAQRIRGIVLLKLTATKKYIAKTTNQTKAWPSKKVFFFFFQFPCKSWDIRVEVGHLQTSSMAVLRKGSARQVSGSSSSERRLKHFIFPSLLSSMTIVSHTEHNLLHK